MDRAVGRAAGRGVQGLRVDGLRAVHLDRVREILLLVLVERLPVRFFLFAEPPHEHSPVHAEPAQHDAEQDDEAA